MKVAVTEVLVFINNVQIPIPLQAPLQPAKVESVVGTADRVRDVVFMYDSEQSLSHAMPAGLLVTVPCPVPLFVTVNVKDTVGVEPQASE